MIAACEPIELNARARGSTSGGTSAHITGPAEWQKKIATGEFKNIPVAAA